MNKTCIALAGCLLASACGQSDNHGRSAPAPPAERAPSVPGASASASPANPATPAVEAEVAEPGRARSVIAIDTHVDTTQRMLDRGDDPSESLPGGHLDLPRMREGGLTGAFFSIWVNPRLFRGPLRWRRTRALIGAVNSFVEAHPDEVALCTSGEDVRETHEAGKIAVLMGLEGAHAFGTDDRDTLLERLQWVHAQGVRYLSPTWSVDSPLGHSSTGDAPEEGLTPLGREVIRRMNEIGMVIDVSHVSDQTFWDIIRLTRRPVFASHSSVHSLSEHPRNMNDEMIRAVGANGGAVCVNYFTHYIDVAYRDRRRALKAAHPERFAAISAAHEGDWIGRGQAEAALALELDPQIAPPDLGTLGEHFERIVRIGGMGAACLGSDFDGIPELPSGMSDVSDLGHLADELERRSLNVESIFGGNVLRILDAQTTTMPTRAPAGTAAPGTPVADTTSANTAQDD